NKLVIGIGVKSSTSDLLIANCDEFIYYDDLVRKEEQRRGRKKSPAKQAGAGRQPATPAPAPDVPATDGAASGSNRSEEERKQEAFDLVLKTIEALADERDEDEKIWGSMIKQAIKRRRPGFNESNSGFTIFPHS